MSRTLESALATVMQRWRKRAREFSADAERSASSVEVAKYVAMAVTLEWAVGDLAVYTEGLSSAALPGGGEGQMSPK